MKATLSRRRAHARQPMPPAPFPFPPHLSAPAAWHSMLLAVSRMEAAGGRAEDLPSAVAEWVETHLSAPTLSLSAAVRAHLDALASAGRAPSTLASRRWRLGRLLDHAGDLPLSRLSPSVLADWIASATPRSRRDDHAAASAFCHWACVHGHLSRNPMAHLPKPPPLPPRPPRILAPAEAAALLRASLALAPAMTLWFAVGLFAGLRPSRELPGLDWGHVDLPGRLLVVAPDRSKTGRARLVPISDNLAAWLETTPPARRHGPVTRFARSAFRRVAAAAGIDWEPDLMRHSRVSYRLAVLRDPARVAAEGGHTPSVMHRHYANLPAAAPLARAYWNLYPDSLP